METFGSEGSVGVTGRRDSACPCLLCLKLHLKRAECPYPAVRGKQWLSPADFSEHHCYFVMG